MLTPGRKPSFGDQFGKAGEKIGDLFDGKSDYEKRKAKREKLNRKLDNLRGKTGDKAKVKREGLQAELKAISPEKVRAARLAKEAAVREQQIQDEIDGGMRVSSNRVERVGTEREAVYIRGAQPRRVPTNELEEMGYSEQSYKLTEDIRRSVGDRPFYTEEIADGIYELRFADLRNEGDVFQVALMDGEKVEVRKNKDAIKKYSNISDFIQKESLSS